ncbi:unnamed protein product, partial [Ixodes pacificus]
RRPKHRPRLSRTAEGKERSSGGRGARNYSSTKQTRGKAVCRAPCLSISASPLATRSARIVGEPEHRGCCFPAVGGGTRSRRIIPTGGDLSLRCPQAPLSGFGSLSSNSRGPCAFVRASSLRRAWVRESWRWAWCFAAPLGRGVGTTPRAGRRGLSQPRWSRVSVRRRLPP